MKSMINDMKESLIYGLKTCLEYFVIIAAILILSIVIDLIGGRDIDHYFSTPYFITASIGLALTFIWAGLYPSVLKMSINSYNAECPGLTQRYVIEKCRSKVLCRYFSILSCFCFVCSLFYDMETYPIIVRSLMAGGFVFLFQYIKYRKQYKSL